MKAPVFAYGTLEKLQAAVQSGKLQYPSYCWIADTSQYAFVNKKGVIEYTGIPKLTGTLDNQIVLSDLTDGVYEITGQHVIVEGSDPTFLSASYIIAIVATDGTTKKIRRITADEMTDYDVSDSAISNTSVYVTSDYLEQHHYATEGYVDVKMEAMKTSIENELKEYIGGIIDEQVKTLVSEYVPEEVERQIQPVDQEDIRGLFAES